VAVVLTLAQTKQITKNVRLITSQNSEDLTESVSKAELGEREWVRNEKRTEK